MIGEYTMFVRILAGPNVNKYPKSRDKDTAVRSVDESGQTTDLFIFSTESCAKRRAVLHSGNVILSRARSLKTLFGDYKVAKATENCAKMTRFSKLNGGVSKH